MRNYNPEEYDPVEVRLKQFLEAHKEDGGRVITFLRSDPNNMDFAVFEAQLFAGERLLATGWAQEIRDKELRKSGSGKDYESVNYTSWLENAETSAIGRALANAGYQGSKRPSREEMQKAQRREAAGRVKAESGQSQPPPPPPPAPPEDTADLEEELRQLLEEHAGALNKDDVAKVRARAERERGNTAWYLKAVAHTRAEINKQEALLAANVKGSKDETEAKQLEIY